MTLCIAAICREENQLILASDLLLSLSWLSADTQSLKSVPISASGRWTLMYAGLPTVFYGLERRAKAALAECPEESLDDAVAACEQAYREELRLKQEGELLSPYGLDRDTFMRKGRRYFGDAEFARLSDELRAVDLETDVLVAGFDLKTRPFLFYVERPGVTTHHNGLGFHAIGTGSVLARGLLAARYDVDVPLYDLIYRVCEAKFAGEKARSVGKKTVVFVMSPDGTHRRIKPERIEPIREAHDAAGIPPVPPAASEAIREHLKEMKWTDRPPPRGLKGLL